VTATVLFIIKSHNMERLQKAPYNPETSGLLPCPTGWQGCCFPSEEDWLICSVFI